MGACITVSVSVSIGFMLTNHYTKSRSRIAAAFWMCCTISDSTWSVTRREDSTCLWWRMGCRPKARAAREGLRY
jgi:hypothetical protein